MSDPLAAEQAAYLAIVDRLVQDGLAADAAKREEAEQNERAELWWASQW